MKKRLLIAGIVLVAGLSGCTRANDTVNHSEEAYFETLKSATAITGRDEVLYHLKDKRTDKCYFYIRSFKTATFEETDC